MPEAGTYACTVRRTGEQVHDGSRSEGADGDGGQILRRRTDPPHGRRVYRRRHACSAPAPARLMLLACRQCAWSSARLCKTTLPGETTAEQSPLMIHNFCLLATALSDAALVLPRHRGRPVPHGGPTAGLPERDAAPPHIRLSGQAHQAPDLRQSLSAEELAEHCTVVQLVADVVMM